MDTTKLQAFCTVAELRSFSEAAKRLNYTQPAISAQIKELENELNVILFMKTGKKLELSDAGRTFLPFAEKLLHDFQECRHVVLGNPEQDHRLVKIGASSLPGVHLLPGLIEKAKALYPDMKFSITISNNYQIERMLFARQIDIGFVGRKKIRAPQGALSEHLLLKDDLVAVFPASHPLALKESLSIEDLTGLPLILPPRNILTRRQVEERFHHLGLPLRLELEIGNTEAIKRMVEHNIGITILSRSAVHKESDSALLRAVSVAGLQLFRYFCLLTLKSAKLPVVSQQFCEFVLRQFSEADLSLIG